MGIDRLERERMGILNVFPHTSTKDRRSANCATAWTKTKCHLIWVSGGCGVSFRRCRYLASIERAQQRDHQRRGRCTDLTTV